MSGRNNMSKMFDYLNQIPNQAIHTLSQQAQQLQAIDPNFSSTWQEKSEELGKIIASRPQNNPAKWIYKQLEQLIKEFEANLNNEQEVGLKIVSVGGTIAYYVEELNYYEPYILVFKCHTADNQKIILIQHHPQLNFMLTTLPKQDPQQPAKRIGFKIHSEDDKIK